MDLVNLQYKWKNRFYDVTKNNKDKKRPNYLHFDVKPNFIEATKKIFKPDYVSRHSFYPFVFFESKLEKIKRLEAYARKIGFDPKLVSKSKPTIPRALRQKLKKDKTVARLLISQKGRSHKYSTWKNRPICYASHFDSMLYSYYGAILSECYELLITDKGIDNEVLAFRTSKPGKKANNITFANRAFNLIDSLSPCVVLAFDVSSFFDILDHKILKNKWLEVMTYDNDNPNKHVLSDDHFQVYRSLTKYSWVDIESVYDEFEINPSNPKGISSSVYKQRAMGLLQSTKVPVAKEAIRRGKKRAERVRFCSPKGFREHVVPHIRIGSKDNPNTGIPQGSPMSGLLSNIYMIDFDVKAKQFAVERNGSYMRYCDDLLCTIPISKGDDPHKIAQTVQDFIFDLAEELKLKVNEEKTDKYLFDQDRQKSLNCFRLNGSKVFEDRLQYLGFNYDGTRVSIRSSSIMRYKKKMKRGINYQLRLRDSNAPGEKLKEHKLRCDYEFNNGVSKDNTKISNFPSYARRADAEIEGSIIKKQMKGRSKEITKQIAVIEKRNANIKAVREAS